MFARLGARAVLLALGVALIFFGVGLIGFGIAAALRPHVGPVWGDVIAGAIFLLPTLIWAIAVISTAPKPSRRAGTSPILTAVIAALAKETPWIALVGGVLASAAELILNRNKSRK